MTLGNLFKILPERQVKEAVKLWLAEDIPNFDIGAIAITNDEKEGHIFVKDAAVIAGIPFITEVFAQLSCTVEWKVEEGVKVTNVPCCVAIVRGPVVQILQGERLALNILSRSCGIATLAKRFCDITNANNWKGSVVGTRKTTPGFRIVEKYAMMVGGAGTHRYDLSSMVMLKDNHIDASIVPDKEKAITQAVNQVRKLAGIHMKIEVESRNEKEALAGAAAGADIIMLDNFNARVACSVAQKLKARYPRVSVEASGNITETNVAGYMGAQIDIISTSRLCHGYSVTDVSMKLASQTPAPAPALSAASLAVGSKRPATATEGNVATKAVTDKNGDSSTTVVEVDVPEKRQKTDENDASAEGSVKPAAEEGTATGSVKSESQTPKVPTESPQGAAATKASSASAVSSGGKTTPVGQKPNNQTTPTPKNSSATGRTPIQRMSSGSTGSRNTPNSQNNRPMNQKNTPTNRYQNNQRTNGNQNQNQRTQFQNQRNQQQNQFNRSNQGGGRGIDRFPGQGAGQSNRSLVKSAGPLHQQLALHAAANRNPMRPGSGAMGMMGPNMATRPQGRGNYGVMGPPGRVNMTGPNAIPISGPRNGGGYGGRPGNAHDWEYGY